MDPKLWDPIWAYPKHRMLIWVRKNNTGPDPAKWCRFNWIRIRHRASIFPHLGAILRKSRVPCTVRKVIQIFRDITWIVVENIILHEIIRVVSRFPRNTSCYILENLFPLGQCVIILFPGITVLSLLCGDECVPLMPLDKDFFALSSYNGTRDWSPVTSINL